MARPRRLQVAGTILHVGTRGNNRRPIYVDDDDRHLFLAMVGVALRRFEWTCLAYCLMLNHYHLVVHIHEPTLSAGMQWLNGGYAVNFNLRHGRCDHLFGKRFFSEVVEDDAHLLELARYVPLNPVRAGACERPEDSPWSSYRATAGLGGGPRWFDPSSVWSYLHDDPRRAIARYVTWVDAGVEGAVASDASRIA